jgi:transcription initiation factor IIE alpha subunit
MKTTILKFECPKCRCGAQAELGRHYKLFLIYKCPNCNSNVAYYDNKISIISDKMILSLKKKNKIKFCKTVIQPRPKKSKNITKDDVLNLKILLETEKDPDSLISKL